MHVDFYWTSDLALDKVFYGNLNWFFFRHSISLWVRTFIYGCMGINSVLWSMGQFECILFLFVAMVLFQKDPFSFNKNEILLRRNNFFIAFFTLCRFGNAPKWFPHLSSTCLFLLSRKRKKKYIERNPQLMGISVLISAKWCISLVLYVFRLKTFKSNKTIHTETNFGPYFSHLQSMQLPKTTIFCRNKDFQM